MTDEVFPSSVFEMAGYQSAHLGTGRWNGVAIISRLGLSDVRYGFEDATDEMAEPRLISADCGGVRVFSVYVPNGRELDNAHYQFKLRWFERLQADLEAEFDSGSDIAICGDFNVAPTDDDVWSVERFAGCTHVSEPEREAIRRLESWGMVDVFRSHHPEPGLYTFWDYRAGDFHMGRGMRIDMILATKSLAARSSFALVDRQARKGEKPSDHAPLIADFD
jgi:exodeoxyribonuclease-3